MNCAHKVWESEVAIAESLKGSMEITVGLLSKQKQSRSQQTP